MPLLGLDRKRGDRTSLQALQPDRFAGLLAIAVGSVIQTVQCSIDLVDQLALAIPGAELDGPVGFRGGAVGQIGVIHILVLQMLQGVLGLFEDVFPPNRELLAEILLLPLIHERLFLGRPVILALVLGRRSVGSMDAVMAVMSVAVAVLAVMAIVPVGTVMAIYVLDPLLILHFTPPYSKRASLLAGRAYRAPPGAGQARNNGSPVCGKIGGLGATGTGPFWRFRRPA